MQICVVTDNEFIFESFKRIIDEKKIEDKFDFFYSEFNGSFKNKFRDSRDFKSILLREKTYDFFKQYDVFFSLHSKQIFPSALVEQFRCINVHPGYNPYNRGWYPHVFSIVNKMPAGVTIHEMDTELDHGPIIYQEKIEIFDNETSFDVYQKIQQKEVELLHRHIETLISGNYSTTQPLSEGNVNTKDDFSKLCELDMDRVGTFREFIDVLRATTFGQYDNAFFYDTIGEKVFVSVNLKKSSCDTAK